MEHLWRSSVSSTHGQVFQRQIVQSKGARFELIFRATTGRGHELLLWKKYSRDKNGQGLIGRKRASLIVGGHAALCQPYGNIVGYDNSATRKAKCVAGLQK